MIRHKKYLSTVFVVVAFVLLMTGCQKHGKLNEGDCKLDVVLIGIPENFEDLPDSIKELCGVEVTLKNISNEKEYTIHLDYDNGFKVQANLNPGTYAVEKCVGNHSEVLAFTPEVQADSVTLQKDKKTKKLEVEIKDTNGLDDSISDIMPTKKILKLDMFSRKIQIDGKVIAMTDILNKDLSIFRDMDTPIEDIDVEPNESYKISGDEIIVEVYNTSSKTVNVAKCKVLSIEITKNIAILPKGVMFGQSLQEVCNAENGLYQTPDKCKGPLLLDYELDNMTCTYNDESSGDKISIRFNCNGWYVADIKYQFEVYE